MKRLWIMRHADATHDASRDHDRPLSTRGQEQARSVGRWLAGRQVGVDAVVASTAIRTMQTAILIRDELFPEHASPDDVHTIQSLYNAPASAWHSVVSEFPEQWDDVLVVGHNPAVQHLVTQFAGDMVPVPTATIADMRVDDWTAFPELVTLSGVYVEGQDLLTA